MVEATCSLFKKILKDTKFSPTGPRFTYQFNFRELAKIIEGVMRSTP